MVRTRFMRRATVLFMVTFGLSVLVGSGLLIVRIVRTAAPNDAPTLDRDELARAPSAGAVGQSVAAGGNAALAALDSTTEVTLPAALHAASRALAEDATAKEEQEALERAVAQLLAGETREALIALRALARGEPEVPMLGRVVRLLEAQLAACAARGGDACR